MAGFTRCAGGGYKRAASGAMKNCDCSFPCADLPSSILITLPDASSWGWSAGTGCSPSVASFTMTKAAYTLNGGDCTYENSGICIGGKIVGFVSGSFKLRLNIYRVTGWAAVFATSLFGLEVSYTGPTGLSLPNVLGTYTLAGSAGATTPPASFEVS